MKKDTRTSAEVVQDFNESGNARGIVYYDMPPKVIYNAVMRTFHREIVRHYELTDIYEGSTLRWAKRIFPLTDEELNEFYG